MSKFIRVVAVLVLFITTAVLLVQCNQTDQTKTMETKDMGVIIVIVNYT